MFFDLKLYNRTLVLCHSSSSYNIPVNDSHIISNLRFRTFVFVIIFDVSYPLPSWFPVCHLPLTLHASFNLSGLLGLPCFFSGFPKISNFFRNMISRSGSLSWRLCVTSCISYPLNPLWIISTPFHPFAVVSINNYFLLPQCPPIFLNFHLVSQKARHPGSFLRLISSS